MTRGIRTPLDLRQRCWVDEQTGCWHWRGATDSSGRPSMRIPALGRVGSLGVLACVFETGEAPKRGEAWHCTCTTRICANPEHRTRGTRSSQMRALGMTRNPLQRARISAGKIAQSAVTPEQRAQIAGSTEALAAIAERYGISESHAHKLRRAILPSSRGVSVFTWRPT